MLQVNYFLRFFVGCLLFLRTLPPLIRSYRRRDYLGLTRSPKTRSLMPWERSPLTMNQRSIVWKKRFRVCGEMNKTSQEVTLVI